LKIDFSFEKNYDCIWIQWVISHLPDDDAIKFLESCRKHLTENGVIVLKENETSNNECIADEEDSSVTRSQEAMKKLVEGAGLNIDIYTYQKSWPVEGLFPVVFMVCR